MREGMQKIVSDEETIVAISTPPGRSGIGIIRISGKNSRTAVDRFFKPHGNLSDLRPRVAVVGTWNDASGEQIDEVVMTWFSAPRSYTGEDVVEISAHGNPLILRRILETTRLVGARLAIAGEFTLRAVTNGKLDLVQAEGIREFVEAQTEQQARIALRQLNGSLSKQIRPIKNNLIDVIAQLEAGIDFADDDVDVPNNDSLIARIRQAQGRLENLRGTFDYGRMLSNGLRVAILGKPNVGKSSLFNCLLRSNRAIVSGIPGTTRDVITETINLDGMPVNLADTAGMRDTSDEVEGLGVNRTLETMSEADVALIVLDGSQGFDEQDRRALQQATQRPHILVINKSDLPTKIELQTVVNGAKRVCVSAQTGEGIKELQGVLRTFLLSRPADVADDLVLTSARQHEAVTSACNALRDAEKALADEIPHEMALLDLYRALGALDELTGEVLTDDILERIFSTFCVGK